MPDHELNKCTLLPSESVKYQPQKGGGDKPRTNYTFMFPPFLWCICRRRHHHHPTLSSSDFPVNSINSRYNFISFAVSCSSFHILHILHSSNYSPRGQEIQLLTTFRASRHISSRRIASFHMYWLIYLFSFTLEVFNVDWIFQVKFSTWWGGEFYPSPP